MEKDKKRFARRTAKNFVFFDQYENGVSFQSDEKLMTIYVSNANEFSYHYRNSELSNEKKQSHIPDFTDDEIFSTNRSLTESNKKYLKKFIDKFAVEQRESDPELPSVIEQIPYNNVLSGSTVTVPLGEGILDFIYSDIGVGSRRFHDKLMFEELLNKLDSIESADNPLSFENDAEEDFYYYERFESTMLSYKDVIYSSLYSSIFPPVFTDENQKSKAYNFYYSYLQDLQNEYKEMIEFCFDENFYPDVLGKLHPFERYNFYRNIKGYPVTNERTETFEIHSRAMRGAKMPYGMPSDELIARLRGNVKRTEQFGEFCEKYDLNESAAEARILFPVFIRAKYNISNLSDMLELEFTKMLEANIKFKKCKRCGKYFILKGNYETNYCDRIADGEIRNCQELAAQDNFKEKNKDNEPLKIYNKYYKRYSARIRVCQIHEAEFNKWKKEAAAKRDDCTNGKLSLEEFIQWNESVFPNRTAKK